MALPTTKGYDGILDEAQFTLGKAALYNNDPSVALQHFSKVNTPQAAWNQAQVQSYFNTYIFILRYLLYVNTYTYCMSILIHNHIYCMPKLTY